MDRPSTSRFEYHGDVVLPKHEHLLPLELDLRPRVFAPEQNLVSDAELKGGRRSVFQYFAGSDGDDGSFPRLLSRVTRDDDGSDLLELAFTGDENAVVDRMDRSVRRDARHDLVFPKEQVFPLGR